MAFRLGRGAASSMLRRSMSAYAAHSMVPIRAVPTITQSRRGFAARRKPASKRSKTPRGGRRNAPAAKGKKPLLSAVLRKIWIKVHPDLFMNDPEIKELNEQSFSKLQGFLSAFKDPSSSDYPKAGSATMRFKMRNPDRDGDGPEFKSFEITVRTAGGRCQNFVQKSLSESFRVLGLPEEFEWDKEYWPMKEARTWDKEEEDSDGY